jgi:hypothetical protein
MENKIFSVLDKLIKIFSQKGNITPDEIQELKDYLIETNVVDSDEDADSWIRNYLNKKYPKVKILKLEETLNPQKMTNEQLRMQMLAGVITEGEYKAKLNKNHQIRESIESLGVMESESSEDNQVAEDVAKAIDKGLFDIYDYTDNYLLLLVYLPKIGEVYVSFNMEVEIYETPYYKPATMYSSNGDPGEPADESDGELGFHLKSVNISKDLEGNEVLFSGMNNSLTGEFEKLSENHKIFDDISERYWDNWNENQNLR